MALPTRNLDDRTFQDLVDESKKRIAASCPEWTDHNVSDPGVTIVELFAWMTEMILYRLNQVPEKHYIKLMELLGLRLREAEPARTSVTSYLSSPQPTDVTLPKGIEVATVRTETQAPIIFSTDEAFQIQPPSLTDLITRKMEGRDGKQRHRRRNLKQLGATGFRFSPFSEPPVPGDALFFGFDNNLSHHVLGLELTCEHAEGMGIDVKNPPWEWEGWIGGTERWQRAAVEVDGTLGMNETGLIRLRLPGLTQREFQNSRAFWIRCRVVEPELAGTNYEKSPVLMNLIASSWGGTAIATHASVVKNEVVGRSEGSPGQVFYVQNTPLLSRMEGETIEVRPKGEQEWEAWTEVPDFSVSQSADKHYTCDSKTGEVRFGPALRHPSGEVRSYGSIPPRAADIRFSTYRYGGGVAGNVQASTLTVLKTSIPYVDRVTNHQAAIGGLDNETIELAQLRAPELLRTRGRAVNGQDYEALARMADSRVYRARCIQPEPNGRAEGPQAGEIYLLLVPRVTTWENRIDREMLKLDAELRKSVEKYMDDYRLLTVKLDIREPEYLWVAVEVSLSPDPNADPDRVRTEVERELYGYLNPIDGGPSGDGWPFGRDLYPSDLFARLSRVRGIQFLKDLRIYLVPPKGDRKEITGALSIPIHGLLASAEHEVEVV